MVLITFGLTERLGSITLQSFINRSITVLSWRISRQNLSHCDGRTAAWVLHAGPLACSTPGEKIWRPGGSQGVFHNLIAVLHYQYKWKWSFIRMANILHSSILNIWEYFSFKVYYSEEKKPWVSSTFCHICLQVTLWL